MLTFVPFRVSTILAFKKNKTKEKKNKKQNNIWHLLRNWPLIIFAKMWHKGPSLVGHAHSYIYGIYHRRILWSSYRKLAWVWFEPTTTEFRSDALTDWATRPCVQLALKANFLQLLQFHRFFSVTFHLRYCLSHSPLLF